MPTSWSAKVDGGPNLLQWSGSTGRSMIDTAVCGTLMSKMEDEDLNLIEEIGLNNYQWSNERG